jgi:hypothetical protein
MKIKRDFIYKYTFRSKNALQDRPMPHMIVSPKFGDKTESQVPKEVQVSTNKTSISKKGANK